MSKTSAELRAAWHQFDCNPAAMVVIDFGPDRIRVAPGTEEAWRALAAVLKAHQYNVRVDDTDSYCCRQMKGGGAKSLHSFGVALDVNWNTNPFKMTPDKRSVHFSAKPSQAERGQDVKHGNADTDMTPAMIEDVRRIVTKDGVRVFEWGGGWGDRKDSMHFELDVTPQELAVGIDWSTVKKPADFDDDADQDRGNLNEIDITVQPGDIMPSNGSVSRGGQTMSQEELARFLIAELAKHSAANVPVAQPQAQPAQDPLRMLLDAFLGKVVPGAAGAAGGAAPVLSPIDKMLGGEMLAGKKTPLAIFAYAILSIMQALGTAGTATGDTQTATGTVLTTLIGGFGALGVLGKVDRVVQLLGIMARK